MSVLTRPAVLLATASVAAGLLAAPSAAWAADTTTNLTAAEMRTALRAVATASTTAGAGGWKAVATIDMTLGSAGSLRATDTIAVDPVHGLYSEVMEIPGFTTEAMFAAEGRGLWMQTDSRQAAALKMMGKPSVRWVLTADKKLKLADYVRENAPDPVTLVEYYALPGTKTVHDDGSVDYRVVSEQKVDVVMETSASSVLTGVSMSTAEEGVTSDITVGFDYAAQSIVLPAAAVTIDEATVEKGVAYLDMAATVKATATQGAADTRRAAKGRTVKVATLRKVVRKDVTAANKTTGVTMVKVKDVSGGVRVYAVNPWTKKSVTYSVKASGKKVLVKKI